MYRVQDGLLLTNWAGRESETDLALAHVRSPASYEYLLLRSDSQRPSRNASDCARSSIASPLSIRRWPQTSSSNVRVRTQVLVLYLCVYSSCRMLFDCISNNVLNLNKLGNSLRRRVVVGWSAPPEQQAARRAQHAAREPGRARAAPPSGSAAYLTIVRNSLFLSYEMHASHNYESHFPKIASESP